MNPEPVNAYSMTHTIRSILLILLLLSFTVGVAHLFILRFQAGDVYPAYSSLRSDPLGTRAFYESLENLGDITLRRNHYFLHSLKFETGTTFFYLGIAADDCDPVPADLIKAFDRLTQAGGRLVLSFLPVNTKNEKKPERERESGAPKPENVASKTKSKENNLASIKKHWGIGFEFNEDLPVKDGKYRALSAVSTRRDLPPVISWHTNLYFNLQDAGWQVLYSSEGHPVMVERPFGKGTVVLCADSFFISNEALRSERHLELLVWLIGPNSKIIFDETHFGIYKQPSVAALLRHYRFHGVFLVLAVMALLFVWKNAAYFVPPRKDDALPGADVVSEKDYARGLIAMLHRNFQGSEILQICGQEWERTFKKDKHVQPGAFERVKEILRKLSHSSTKSVDVVMGYREISKIISEDKKI